MLDFAMLPPEVISARMYSGPGSGPMMAAAAAWDVVTGQLNSSALGYSSVISELQDEVWSGAASEAMAAAATPYVAWLATTATLTEQAASQARAAAAAYETAFAATVPPAVVTANRVQLATLVATNFFGQNTSMIAATEAAYAQMWAQDAAAMYGYAVAASVATELTPFREPPKTTNAASQSAQSAAPAQALGTSVAGDIAGQSHATVSQLTSTVPQQFDAVPTVEPADSSPSIGDAMLGGFSNFNTLTGPEAFGLQIGRTVGNSGSFFTALARALGGSVPKIPAVPAVPSASVAGAFESAAAAPVRHAVLASMGEAAPVAQLSVPRAWADATPVAAAAEEPLWLSEEELAMASSSQGLSEPSMVGAAPTAGMGPMTGMMGRSSVSNVLRVGPRRFTMPRPSVGG